MNRSLSIVIPVLNEVDALGRLCGDLFRQQGLLPEIVVSDGGSTDGTHDLVRHLAAEHPGQISLTAGEKGRPRQMERGIATAGGEIICLLHADSRLPSPDALHSALDLLDERISRRRDHRVAGRFGLRFHRTDPNPSLGYYFYECKARLDRPGCAHGDQGLMLPRPFLTELGGLSGHPPMLAETRLADAARARGELILYPAEIVTSARRFETEGLRERQTLNAIIMNFAVIGWEPFFSRIAGLYRDHDRSGRLDLSPLLEATAELMAALPRPERSLLWRATGSYVRDNAWQLAFWLDVRHAYRSGTPAGTIPTPRLDAFDRSIAPLLAGSAGRLAAEWLTRRWFRRERRRALRKAGSTQTAV